MSGEQWRGDHEWAALADDVAEMTALAVHLMERIEGLAGRKQPVTRGWDEGAAREFIPLFQQWLEYATVVKNARLACRDHGYAVEGADDFLHAYNRAKLMARDFDTVVESVNRVERGEGRGRPLREIVDELRHRPGTGGGA